MLWKITLDDAGHFVSIERIHPTAPLLSRLALGPHPRSLSDLLLAIARWTELKQAREVASLIRCEGCGRWCERHALSSIIRCAECMANLGY